MNKIFIFLISKVSVSVPVIRVNRVALSASLSGDVSLALFQVFRYDHEPRGSQLLCSSELSYSPTVFPEEVVKQ